MRARWLIVLSTVAMLLVGYATVTALAVGRTGAAGTSVDVSDLGAGQVLAVDVTLPGADHESARVFVVHPAGRPIAALLGVSTHLGCALRFHGDAQFGEGFGNAPVIAFEDPCGGSTYSLDGRCIGGPCPRDLDRYAVEITDHRATFDLHHLQRGPLRGTAQ